MKTINITILICAIFTLIAALLPITTKGNLLVNISHIGGITYLLFLTPIYLLVTSILALNGKIVSLKSWYLPASILGLLLAFVACLAGLSYIENFARMAGRFGAGGGNAEPGIGYFMLIIFYSSATIAPMFNEK
ncbi:hypothetical protein [uncultured Umboniibacter sp.]|uniref:hypothetical protein n=1 Tax=uncultured Umboniibacter sp. TaxID=1798917 RepID=UPI00261449F3|nr:hypothetical protein [uncultured Umboniibacter sp.]